MGQQDLFERLRENIVVFADPEKAIKMSAYMRNLFPFLGIQTPERRKVAKGIYKELKLRQVIDWEFIESCWKIEEREFQYIAVDYLIEFAHLLKEQDLDKIRDLVIRKSWWDTVDGLDGVVGKMALQFPQIKEEMILWSKEENFWIRRISIDFQLAYKNKTDEKLLEKVIVNNLGQTEFFINKAIGWSLREYSKTNPTWVKQLLDNYKTELAALSIKEASKYIA